MAQHPQIPITDYLQDLLLSAEDVQEFLEELVRFSLRALSDGSELLCGITLLRRNRAGTVVSSSDRAQVADEIQYRFAEGPCLRASLKQTPIYIPDMRCEPRWQDYTAVMVREGILSALALPFQLEGDTKAALNLYSEEPHYFDTGMREVVQAHVDQTSRAFRLAVRIAQRDDHAADLRSALESRTTIDLAVGIIMGQNQCTQDEAFTILKTASNTRNIKLRELAAQVVAGCGGSNASTHFND